MALCHSQKVETIVHECPIDLGLCITHVNLYVTSIENYDVIVGMDWLESHWVVLDYRSKIVHFVSDEIQSMVLQGETRPISLRRISYL
jgi:hypothetical protein